MLDISRTGSMVTPDRASRLELVRTSHLELADDIGPVISAAPTGSVWVIPLGSLFPVPGGAGTIYLVSGFSAEEAKTAFPCPRPLRVKRFNMAVTQMPGAGRSFIYTLRKGNAAGTSFADTALQIVISGSEVEGEADGAVDFARGERLCVKLTKSAGVPDAHHVGGLEIELL